MKNFLSRLFEINVSDKITNNFIDTGKIEEKYLICVATKIKNNIELTKNEMIVFTSSVSEINEILRNL